MRTPTLGSLAAATTLAVLAPLAPATAGAAAPTDLRAADFRAADLRAADFRAAACREADHADLASGSATRTTVLSEQVEGLRTLTVTAERLSYANGARCDLVHVDGRLRFGQGLKGYKARLRDMGTLVVAGADQGEVEHRGISTGAGGTPPLRELDQEVLVAVVYTPTDSGTIPPLPDLPAEWQGQPYTFTHTRTTAEATFRARVGERQSFTVTPATRAAAARRLERDLSIAPSAADRRDARRTYRLALRGVRLVMKPFTARWSGELPG